MQCLLLLLLGCILYPMIGVVGIQPRYGHTMVQLDDHLYIIGGKEGHSINEAQYADQHTLLTLNLTQSFNTSLPPWKEVKNTGDQIPPGMVDAAIAVNQENKSFYLIGTNDQSSHGVWKLNLTNHTWHYLNLVGLEENLLNASSVMVNQDMYYHGGASPSTSTVNVKSGFYRFNTMTETWSILTPPPIGNDARYQHTLSYVKHRHQLFLLGGADQNDVLVPMHQVLTYDISQDLWTLVETKGNPPNARRKHSAVVMEDCIIVFGGCDAMYTELYNDIRVLNTTTMEWSQPTLTGRLPSPRYEHTAIMIDHYMLIVFGVQENEMIDDQMYIINTDTWQVESRFESTPKEGTIIEVATEHVNTADNASSDSSLPMGILIAISVGVVLTLLIMMAVVYIRRRRQQKNTMVVGAPRSPTLPIPQVNVQKEDPVLDLPSVHKDFILDPPSIQIHVDQSPIAISQNDTTVPQKVETSLDVPSVTHDMNESMSSMPPSDFMSSISELPSGLMDQLRPTSSMTRSSWFTTADTTGRFSQILPPLPDSPTFAATTPQLAPIHTPYFISEHVSDEE